MARILIGNVKGPTGATGPQGVQGPRGVQGIQGPLPPLTNNGLATVAGVSALDAVMGKTLQDQLDQQNSDLNNKFLLNAECKYLAHKQYTLNGTGGTDWINIPLSALGIVGKKMPEHCAPMACISWSISDSTFVIVYCNRYDATTVQVKFNKPLLESFRISLLLGLVDA